MKMRVQAGIFAGIRVVHCFSAGAAKTAFSVSPEIVAGRSAAAAPRIPSVEGRAPNRLADFSTRPAEHLRRSVSLSQDSDLEFCPRVLRQVAHDCLGELRLPSRRNAI
jgi:hypothetical protein